MANNYEVKIDGTVATITVDLSKNLGPSASGKSIIIASSKGNVEIEPGIMLGLNVYRKR